MFIQHNFNSFIFSGHEESYNPPPEYLPTDEEVGFVIEHLKPQHIVLLAMKVIS